MMNIDPFFFFLFRWSVSVISTRVNNLVTTDNQIDLCQQLGDTSIHYDSNLKQVECKTMNVVQENEQIFMFYGQRTNSELLIHKVFVPDYMNLYDNYFLRLVSQQIDVVAFDRLKMCISCIF